MTQTTYTITAFDPVEKTIDVTFGDQSWSKLKLYEPYPRTPEEMKGWMRKFLPQSIPANAPPAEPTDFSYINDMVGVVNTIDLSVMTVGTTPVYRAFTPLAIGQVEL